MRLTSLKKRLGDILVDVGIISPEQLQEALETQKRSGGKLGAILSQMGIINEEVMLAFLGKQCGVPYLSLAEYGDISTDVIRCLPESVIRYQNLLPIAVEGNTVTVAMADPFNVFAVDDIKLMTGYDVQVAIASESEIKAAIVKYFSHLPPSPSSAPDAAAEAKENASVEQLLDVFLSDAVRSRASSIYYEPQSNAVRIRYRIDGQLIDRGDAAPRLMPQCVSRLKSLAGLDVNERRIPQEGRMKTRVNEQELDLKVSFIPTIFGERLRLDILDPSSACRELSKLGFENESLSLFKKNIELPRGLIVIAGPADSGKTTTLYSALAHCNYPDRDILSVEDPVEFVLPGITQVQVDARTGITLAANLQSFLRQSPDIIMVSEARDHWSTKLAVSAALEGRLALTSVTETDALRAIQHLCDVGIDPFLVSTSLMMVVTQRLMRMICPYCKDDYVVPRTSLNLLGGSLPLKEGIERVTLWRGRGCPKCDFTGYSGRTGVFEVMEINEQMRSMIIERAPLSLLKEAAVLNSPSLVEAAWRKVAAGITSVEEMLRIIKLSN